MRGPLAAEATEPVENVVLFIADSLRFDHLPPEVRQLGVYGRGIATSTFTASGYPSILTGNYPSTHQVWNFEDTLSTVPELLSRPDRSGIDATDVWSNVSNPAKKPPLRICRQTTETTIDDLRSPFVLVVHDEGGHMMYGKDDETERFSSHSTFFDEYADSPAEIRRRYSQSVANSVETFRDIVAELRARGELEQTLVIFTSDHGELLGEYGGIYTHGDPLVPELVDVPVVFAGVGLPQGQQLDEVVSTADIAPTGLAALGNEPTDVDGRNLWDRTLPDDRVVRTEVWKQTSYPSIEYKATAVWTTSGGRVRHLKSFPSRSLYMCGVQLYFASHANMVRQRSGGYLPLLRAYLPKSIDYGEPPPQSLIDKHMITDFSRRQQGEETEHPKPDTEQLRELGYLE